MSKIKTFITNDTHQYYVMYKLHRSTFSLRIVVQVRKSLPDIYYYSVVLILTVTE